MLLMEMMISVTLADPDAGKYTHDEMSDRGGGDYDSKHMTVSAKKRKHEKPNLRKL